LQGHLAFNPAVGLELPKEEVRLPMNYLTVEEVELLINQTDTTQEIGIRDRAILEILYSSAIRRNELLALGLYDIDRSRRLLMIRQGKGKRDRVVPLGVRALEWLEKYLLQVRPWLMAGNGRKKLGPMPDESDRIFLGATGKPISPVQLSQLVRGYLESAEIKKSGACHVLRHTAATLMLENGADLRSLQTLLGHASLNTTQVYTHVTIDRLRQVHDATHPAKPDQRPK
jgi:integrase/recombinase XerD